MTYHLLLNLAVFNSCINPIVYGKLFFIAICENQLKLLYVVQW